jgi:hypothetical protein
VGFLVAKFKNKILISWIFLVRFYIKVPIAKIKKDA